MCVDWNISSSAVMILNGKIYLHGKEAPSLPNGSHNFSVTQINDKVYVNGFEWKDNKWKRTLKALWYKYF